jgi:hypothetical protein
MIAALALALLLQGPAPAAAPAAAPQAQSQAELPPESVAMLYVFFRARYFHAAAELRQCLAAEPERTRALNARYDALKLRLTERFGADNVNAQDFDPPERGADPACRTGVTLAGYENALNELSQQISGSGQ